MHDAADGESIRQTAFVRTALSGTQKWKIAFGHHPYLSNGPHGNAGSYDGNPADPFLDGTILQDFFETDLMGKVDLYLCGHDHSMQVLPSGHPGTLLCVSGGGSGSLTPLSGTNPALFGESRFGFARVEIRKNDLTVEMYGTDGLLLYRQTMEK